MPRGQTHSPSARQSWATPAEDCVTLSSSLFWVKAQGGQKKNKQTKQKRAVVRGVRREGSRETRGVARTSFPHRRTSEWNPKRKPRHFQNAPNVVPPRRYVTEGRGSPLVVPLRSCWPSANKGPLVKCIANSTSFVFVSKLRSPWGISIPVIFSLKWKRASENE